jgi:ATP-dependent RNA circularization protein (DNA/RNA ligase family)
LIEYPKIETLYDRDPDTFKVISSKLRLTEFGNIKSWHITEKVDGTNIRVIWQDGAVSFNGRTDNAQMPPFLYKYLADTFTSDLLTSVFQDTNVTLYGEGYGAKIQKSGGLYRAGVSFRLFDVLVGRWWWNASDVRSIAVELGIRAVPDLGEIDGLPYSLPDLIDILDGDRSIVAQQDGGQGYRQRGYSPYRSAAIHSQGRSADVETEI